MSVVPYESILPALFGTSGSSANSATQSHPPATAHAGQANINPAASSGQATGQENVPQQKQIVRRFADITEIQNNTARGLSSEIVLTERICPPPKKNEKLIQKYSEYSLILRRTVLRKNGVLLPRKVELEIQSDTLCEALRKIVVSTYDNVILKPSPIKIPQPFAELFFFRTEIERFVDDHSQPEELREEVKLLRDFLRKDSEFNSIITDYERSMSTNQIVGDILWTLYPPNSIVIRNSGGLRECWLCRNVIYNGQCWDFVGLGLDFDGTSVGLVQRELHISLPRSETMAISELPLIPAAQFPDWEEFKAGLLRRGKEFSSLLGKDLQGYAPRVYKGPSWEAQGDDAFTQTPDMNERVVVDFSMYRHDQGWRRPQILDLLRKNRRKKPHARGVVARARRLAASDSESTDAESGTGSDSESINEVADAAPHADFVLEQDSASNTDSSGQLVQDAFATLSNAVCKRYRIPDVLLLCPARIPAFSLQDNNWRWILIDELKPVQWNSMAFDSIQLGHDVKHVIETLVMGHRDKKYCVFDDLIQGKGQGLVFLLHGDPGLGKTFTAESVADYVQCPLYRVSGGELSTDVQQVERRLKKIFHTTKKWNAVVLFDEADVLMAKRKENELERNTIVAVFLRMIEYFEGILFLTSNRATAFDEAFKSRIHLTIQFPELAPEKRAQIWKNLINFNKAVKQDESWTPELFSTLGELNINGRTIKNILRTAACYAVSQDKPLGVTHVNTILNIELRDKELQGPIQKLNDLLSKQQGMSKREASEHSGDGNSSNLDSEVRNDSQGGDSAVTKARHD